MKSVSLDAQLMTLRTLWGAMAISTVTLAGIDHHLRGSTPPPPAPPESTVLALTAVAASLAVVSLVLPRRLYAQAVAARGKPIEGVVTDAQLAPRVQLFMTPFILSLALSESVSIFGFVIGRLGGPQLHSLALFGAGTALSLLRFPTRGSLS